MSTSLINPVHAQNDPNILLHIAVQADKQILNQLEKKYGNEILIIYKFYMIKVIQQ